MRECFRRKLHLQKQIKSGKPATKRRKNIYFEQMLFLMLKTEDCATSSNYSPTTGSNAEGDIDERKEDEEVSCGSAPEISMCRKQQHKSNALPKVNYK